MSQKIYAQVTITEADLSNICVDGGYYGLGDIVIQETLVNDFGVVGANNTREYLRIQLPANFEFKASTGNVSYSDPGGTDFDTNPVGDGPTYFVGTNYVEISYIILNESVLNSFILEGFQVRAINFGSSGNITRVSGTVPDADVNGAPIGTVFGSLTSIEAPAITTQPTPDVVCEGDIANFSVIATGGGLSYQWQRSTDGFATHTNIDNSTDGGIYSNFNSSVLQINNSITAINGYTYRVEITGACLPIITSAEVGLTVNALPAAPVVTNNSQVICLNETINLPVASGAGGTFNWYNDVNLNTLIHTGSNPTLLNIGFDNSVAGNTVVYVAETSASTCEGIATAVSLTVNPLPNDALAVTPSNTEVCDGGTLTFTVASSQSGVNYQLFDDTNTAFSGIVGGSGGSINIISNVFDFATLGGTETITVQRTTAELPAVMPVTVVVLEAVLVMEAVPDCTDQLPVPVVGLMAAMVKVGVLHCSISTPASAAEGAA